MNTIASALSFAPMTKVAPLSPAGQFGPAMSAAQARAAAMTPAQRAAADAFKSVMMQSIGKKIASGRGIGMASQVEAEMLKLQGLR